MSPEGWKSLRCAIPGYDPDKTKGDAYFVEKLASDAVGFFSDCIQHVEGDMAGKPFVLERWEEAIVANIFGWQRKDAAGRTVRRYREVFVYCPRKQGKTPLCAGIGLLVFFCDGEAGQQNYIAAADKEQAGMLFRQMRGMVEREPELANRCRIYGGNAAAGQSRSLVRESDGSFMRIISADAHTKHGGNPHLVLIDELHAQPNRELVDVLSTSMASTNRKQSLFICITTADFDRPSICNEKYDYACKVRDGVIDDLSFLPVIYEAALSDDWTDPKVWEKANPNLGVSVSREYLERECKRAQEVPAFENTFKRLHLNIKTEQAERVIRMEDWDACKAEMDGEWLHRRACFGGLDIGATSDFTAFTLLFPHDDGEQVEVTDVDEKGDEIKRELTRQSYTLRSWFWLPERPVRRDPKMAAVIDAWRKEGFIRTTEGNVVDYRQVVADVVQIVSEYSLTGLAFDRGFQGSSTGTELLAQFGEEVVTSFPQGILSMNAPFREFLELLMLRRLFHDGNPVMRWMVSNVSAERRGGLMKPSKDRSTEKIDGVTAATMAMGIATTRAVEAVGNYYETNQLEML